MENKLRELLGDELIDILVIEDYPMEFITINNKEVIIEDLVIINTASKKYKDIMFDDEDLMEQIVDVLENEGYTK